MSGVSYGVSCGGLYVCHGLHNSAKSHLVHSDGTTEDQHPGPALGGEDSGSVLVACGVSYGVEVCAMAFCFCPIARLDTEILERPFHKIITLGGNSERITS